MVESLDGCCCYRNLTSPLLIELGKENQVGDFLSRLHNKGENILVDDNFPDENLFCRYTNSPWFIDITNYLTTGKMPPHFSPKERRRIVKMSAPYSWIKGDIFYTDPDMIICRCVREDKMFDIIKACHDEPCGVHFVDRSISYKILHSSYLCPTLFRYVNKYVCGCDSFQRMSHLVQEDEIPL
jgi:hypothetical protein